MSAPKRKRRSATTSATAVQEESSSGDFSSGSDNNYEPLEPHNPSRNRSTSRPPANGSSALFRDTSSSSQTLATRKSQKRSKFDDYFGIESAEHSQHRQATCKICPTKTRLKMTRGNTTGLRKHLQSKHRKEFLTIFPDEDSAKHKSAGSTPGLTIPQMFSSKSETISTNDDDDAKIVDWIAIKYLPFNFFNDEYTQNFFKLKAPGTNFPKKDKLRRLALSRFDYLRGKVLAMLQKNDSKISFTIDGWTSVSGKSYYGITAHFIDDEWDLQSITLDFVPAHGRHTGKDIATIFFKCLKENGLDSKIQGITMDNASANTSFIQELHSFIPELNVEDCHFRCFAHILNLAVQDLFKKLVLVSESSEEMDVSSSDEETDQVQEVEDDSNAICKIRSIFSKIKRSEQLLIKFRSACEATGISRFLSPILDVPTRWNSTDDMLEVALHSKNGLGVLCQNVDLQDYALTDEEWLVLEEVHKLLVNFKILSKKLEGEKYVTLPTVIVSINLLLDKIEKKALEWDTKPDRSSADEKLIVAFQAARDKIVKHYKKTNWIYAAVLMLDPRHKLETFDMTDWGQQLKAESIDKFETIYKSYHDRFQGQRSRNAEQVKTEQDNSDFLIDFDELYEIESSPSEREWRYELQRFYGMPRCDKKTDILKWWKHNASEFPILSSVARDFFSIPATSVPAERLFSRASLTMRKHRNRLNNESARCLLCLNDWVKNKKICETA